MKRTRLTAIGLWSLFVAVFFSTPISGLAQSDVMLIAHYVEVVPAQDGISYNVNVYFSVADGSGNLVKDLPVESLSVLEDGQQVELRTLSTMAEEPTNFVLVMDTSGSMNGAFIDDAKAAATAFITGLKPTDRVAILTFDDAVKTRVDFSADQDILNEKIKQIVATPEGGTCLYDAAYAAVRMFATEPKGSRAVILFTDGRDETFRNGAVCSTKSVDEVIAIASKGELRTPIYTVGLGLEKQIDTATLQRFADATGGYYLYSSSSTKLVNAFQVFSAQTRSQYIANYKSLAKPGDHSLVVGIKDSDPDQKTLVASDLREFLLPALPPHILFLSPLAGESVGDHLKIVVALTSQGQILIQRVAFEVNGATAGVDDTTPYEIELDLQQYAVGPITISAVAYGENNTELARTSVDIAHAPVIEPATLVPTEMIVPLQTMPTAEEPNQPILLISILLSGVTIVGVGILIFVLVRRQNQAKIQEVESFIGGDLSLAPLQGIPVTPRMLEPRKVITPEPGSDALGVLTIEASDDSSLIGHTFEITTPLITLGRSADNDLNFPSDKPVSRHHAEIYQISGRLYLRQVETADATGTAKPPTYGTFLNQSAMASEPALLKTGDVIQLGKRVRLRFESHKQDLDANAVTSDDADSIKPLDVDQTEAQ